MAKHFDTECINPYTLAKMTTFVQEDYEQEIGGNLFWIRLEDCDNEDDCKQALLTPTDAKRLRNLLDNFIKEEKWK
jgi:hypothetical protein